MSDQGSSVGTHVTGPTGGAQPVHLPGIPGLTHAQDTAASTSGMAATGDNIVDQIVKQITALGQKIIDDLTNAQALAAYVDPSTGQAADPDGAQALAAIIPLVTLVVHGPPAATGAAALPTLPDPHIVTDIQKARIVLLRFNDPKFKAALAPLAQDIQSQLGSLLGVGGVVMKVLGLAGIAA